MSEDEARANYQLIAVMARLKMSNKGLARRVRELSEARRPGAGLRTDHVTVLKWLRGAQPRPETASLIAEALSIQAGERITLADIGMAGGDAEDTDAALAYPDAVIESILASGRWPGETSLAMPDSLVRTLHTRRGRNRCCCGCLPAQTRTSLGRRAVGLGLAMLKPFARRPGCFSGWTSDTAGATRARLWSSTSPKM